MSAQFEYRPKFVDIRVKPPKAGEEEAKRDVHALKPGERRCENPDCSAVATARAPKSRDMPGQHYWFCQPHAAEYNKRWDFYAGMNEAQIRAHKEKESVTGGRPTWDFKASRASREAASQAAFEADPAGKLKEAFGIFSAARRKAEVFEQRAQRNLGKMERAAMADLDLHEDADNAAIRTRYTELLKRLHPDANGGDRSTEAKLQKVIKAYKTLKKAGMV
ncbi:MAG: DnaJ domain protein [Caulobacteraceae bacterium]|nr:DnaJ domain protein [Caulobacteraceae bacterium]